MVWEGNKNPRHRAEHNRTRYQGKLNLISGLRKNFIKVTDSFHFILDTISVPHLVSHSPDCFDQFRILRVFFNFFPQTFDIYGQGVIVDKFSSHIPESV